MSGDPRNSSEHVPDYSMVGFGGGSGGGAAASNRLAEAHAAIPEMKALALQVCVGASYNSATNQICFTVPIYGDLCVTSPVSIPASGSLKACAQTCGSIIPTGLKVTIYLNDNPIISTTVVGFC